MRGPSHDLSFNFGNLCVELDESSFSTHFIIPELRRIEHLLSEENDEQLIKSYFDVVKPSLYHDGNEIILVRRGNFHYAFTKFTNCYDTDSFAYFPRNSGAENEILTFKDFRNNSFLEINSVIISLLLRYNLPQLLRQFKSQVTEKIEKIESEITREKDSLNEILDI